MARTFYWRQARTVKFLSDVAYREARNLERNDVEVLCYQCNEETVVDGAVEAIQFLVNHNRHRTYARAYRRGIHDKFGTAERIPITTFKQARAKQTAAKGAK